MPLATYNALHNTLYGLLTLWLKNSTRDLTTYSASSLGGDSKKYSHTYNGVTTDYGIHLWDGISEPRVPGFNLFIGTALPVRGKNNPQWYRVPFSINILVLQGINEPETTGYIARELAGKTMEAIRYGGGLYDLSGTTPVALNSHWWLDRRDQNVSVAPRSTLRRDGLVEYAVTGFVTFIGDTYS